MFWCSSAAGGYYGNADGRCNRSRELAIKTCASAVAIHRREQDFSGATIFRFARPFQDFLSRWLSSSCNPDLGLFRFARSALAIDSDDHSLRTKAIGDLADQFCMGDSGGV